MEKTDIPAQLFAATPQCDPSVFVAKGAIVIGDVQLKKQASVWYNAVLRGDINKICIGERSNIQDGCVCHLENELGCIVGDDVTVGHKAILHGCTIEDAVLIGMNATVLNGAVIGKGSIIGAGAVVKEGMIVPPLSLVVGVPAKIVKSLPESTIDTHRNWAKKYVALAEAHKADAHRFLLT